MHNSLVSPGTELKGGWKAYKANFDKADPNQNDKPEPFGYSNSGIVLECGEGVTEFKPGDRVAAIGGGYALHTQFALVPKNLCFHIPENMTFIQAAYTMLAATALQALRRGEPVFGESAAVIGLGIVGQLTVQLLQLAGLRVIGWDTMKSRTDLALKRGIDACALVGKEDPVKASMDFTDNAGLDFAVLAFGGDATAAVESLIKCFRTSRDTHPMGVIVDVGGVKFNYGGWMINMDIRRSSRTGPGYHDLEWERGSTYPPVFIRWDTRENVKLCLRLISEGKLDVDSLTSHVIPFDNIEKGLADALNNPDDMLGVVFSMKQ